MSNGHGGAREGAGRKKHTEKFAPQIDAGLQIAADNLVDNIETLQLLASNDRVVIHEEWLPAGMVMIDDLECDDTGKTSKIRRLAFPDLPAEQLVLVKRRVVNNGPSETAAIYLVDRVAGKPTAHIDAEGEIEHKLPPDVQGMITKLYGSSSSSNSSA